MNCYDFQEIASLKFRNLTSIEYTPDGQSVVLFSNTMFRVYRAESLEEIACYHNDIPISEFHYLHPSGKMFLTDAQGNPLVLGVKNLEFGVPLVTPARIWRYDKNEYANPSVACLWCGYRSDVTDMHIGKEINCPHCKNKLQVNPFIACNYD